MNRFERFVWDYTEIEPIATILKRLRAKGYKILRILTDYPDDPHFLYIFAEIERWPEEFYFIIDPPNILYACVHTSSGLSELDPKEFGDGNEVD